MSQLVIVDVESDGPCPGLYSMVSFGAVLLKDQSITFHGKTAPISNMIDPAAVKVLGLSREEHMSYPHPAEVMKEFAWWLKKQITGRPIFVSDNPAFDWQWINYYFHKFVGCNPFGYSARRIGDIYSGLTKDMGKSSEWKKLRKTRHTHNPVDDAKGNAEALEKFRELGLSF